MAQSGTPQESFNPNFSTPFGAAYVPPGGRAPSFSSGGYGPYSTYGLYAANSFRPATTQPVGQTQQQFQGQQESVGSNFEGSVSPVTSYSVLSPGVLTTTVSPAIAAESVRQIATQPAKAMVPTINASRTSTEVGGESTEPQSELESNIAGMTGAAKLTALVNDANAQPSVNELAEAHLNNAGVQSNGIPQQVGPGVITPNFSSLQYGPEQVTYTKIIPMPESNAFSSPTQTFGGYSSSSTATTSNYAVDVGRSLTFGGGAFPIIQAFIGGVKTPLGTVPSGQTLQQIGLNEFEREANVTRNYNTALGNSTDLVSNILNPKFAEVERQQMNLEQESFNPVSSKVTPANTFVAIASGAILEGAGVAGKTLASEAAGKSLIPQLLEPVTTRVAEAVEPIANNPLVQSINNNVGLQYFLKGGVIGAIPSAFALGSAEYERLAGGTRAEEAQAFTQNLGSGLILTGAAVGGEEALRAVVPEENYVIVANKVQVQGSKELSPVGRPSNSIEVTFPDFIKEPPGIEHPQENVLSTGQPQGGVARQVVSTQTFAGQTPVFTSSKDQIGGFQVQMLYGSKGSNTLNAITTPDTSQFFLNQQGRYLYLTEEEVNSIQPMLQVTFTPRADTEAFNQYNQGKITRAELEAYVKGKLTEEQIAGYGFKEPGRGDINVRTNPRVSVVSPEVLSRPEEIPSGSLTARQESQVGKNLITMQIESVENKIGIRSVDVKRLSEGGTPVNPITGEEQEVQPLLTTSNFRFVETPTISARLNEPVILNRQILEQLSGEQKIKPQVDYLSIAQTRIQDIRERIFGRPFVEVKEEVIPAVSSKVSGGGGELVETDVAFMKRNETPVVTEEEELTTARVNVQPILELLGRGEVKQGTGLSVYRNQLNAFSQSQGLKSTVVPKLATSNIQVTRLKSIQAQAQAQSQVQAQAQAQANAQAQAFSQSQAVGISQGQAQGQAQSQAQSQAQAQAQAQSNAQAQAIAYTLENKNKLALPNSLVKKASKLEANKKTIFGFVTEVRERGKFLELEGGKALAYGQALERGKEYVQKHIAATLEVLPVAKQAQESNYRSTTAQNLLGGGFTKPVAGSPLNRERGEVFIQERGTRLGSRTEVSEIQQAKGRGSFI